MVPDTPLAVCLAGPRSAAAIAASSCDALDRPLTAPAELTVAIASDEATVLGAFQRATAEGCLRRASGGPAVRVGPGTVHVTLALAAPSTLVACDERQIVNRYVRPLLRALSRHGHLAHYFGRDWISVAHRPAGWVGFAHDAGTRRTLFEAFVAVSVPFALEQRDGFLGKPHATLEELRRAPVDATALALAIADTYAADAARRDLAWPAGTTDASRARPEPPWAATVEEAIGTLGAGPDAAGTFRVGGDLLVSRDALGRLEARAAAASRDDLPRIIDETLAAGGVALDGVKSLGSVLDVVRRARAG
ncbi:MAG TPA: hypothetical protein VIF09_05200 [Polyangiaceae bacterium]|jgi:hypothetical protein